MDSFIITMTNRLVNIGGVELHVNYIKLYGGARAIVHVSEKYGGLNLFGHFHIYR